MALPPIDTVDLFPSLHTELLTLLRNLPRTDWNKPTVARLWTVKDIAAHLLDGDLRRLSFQRDGWPLPTPTTPISSYRDLVDHLNRINAIWVEAAKRISPDVLIDLLDQTGPQVHAFFKTLDPEASAPFPVAWAGDSDSPNWFDIAREYTEKWHHQQQIRDAVGAPSLTASKWLAPVLDTFMRGLPHQYRALHAPDGTQITCLITGEAGGTWRLRREDEAWHLVQDDDTASTTQVRLNQDTAWRLFTKGLRPTETRARIFIEGNEVLGLPILNMVAVMA